MIIPIKAVMLIVNNMKMEANYNNFKNCKKKL